MDAPFYNDILFFIIFLVFTACEVEKFDVRKIVLNV